MALRADPWAQRPVDHLLAVRPGASHLTSLSLSAASIKWRQYQGVASRTVLRIK